MPTFTYNGTSIPNIINKFSYNEDHAGIDVACEFLVLESSASALIAACQTLEEKLTEINKDLTITLGGSTELTFSHSSNTGFLARPHLTIITDPATTATSRHYSWTCNIGLPFVQTPYNGRREGNFAVSYGPNRQRVVNFTVLYTATTTYTCLQNYNAYVKTWCAGILTALGGTYELVSENHSEEHEQKILHGSLVYKEILANQSKSMVNDPKIVDLSVNYSINVAQTFGLQLSVTGYKEAKPAIGMTISFSCKIDKEQVTNDSDISDSYTVTLRPWLIEHAIDVLKVNAYSPNASSQCFVIQREAKNIDTHNYSLSGSMQILIPGESQQVLNYTENISKNNNENISMRKLWDGRDYSFATWSIGKTRTLKRTIYIDQLNTIPTSDITPYTDPSETGKYIKTDSSESLKAEKVGQATTDTRLHKWIIYTKTISENYNYVEVNEQQAEIRV